MQTCFINARIILPDRILSGSVMVENGKITRVAPENENICAEGAQIVDCRGLYLSPGFIELHTHGAGGHDFLDGSIEANVAACRTHMAHGITSILPTTLSSTDDELFFNLSNAVETAKIRDNMPEILGVHLEGPYFSPAQNGAQDKSYIKAPKPEEYKRIFAHCPQIKIWSVAPELPGAMEMGNWMRSNGIIGSIGHSNAVYSEVIQAVENGYTMITHLFNGMSRLTRKNAKMFLGVAESALALDDLIVEIIADGCHLPPELLQLIYKVKGPDRICLVTDSMRAAGTDVQESILGSLKNGQRVEIENGVAYMPDRTSFGGSISTADRLVRTMVHKAGVSLVQAIRMITMTPATVLSVQNRLGSIAPGKDADLLLFNDNIDIQFVMCKGKICKNLL